VLRRSLFAAVLITALVPALAVAGGWHTYTSKSFGVAFRYPAGWRVTAGPPGPTKQIQAYSAGAQYSFLVSVYPLKPGKSPSATLNRYITYTRTLNGPTTQRMHWKKTSFAGKKAEGAVSFPPTEGGVPLAIGVYVFGSRSHTYAVTMQMRSQHLPKTLSAFPAVYRQIIQSWRFL
jgi:hypothetical protein